MRFRNLALASAALLAISSQAQALTFDFSFSNEIGLNAGTVYGRIYGLGEGWSSASQVLITSLPESFEGVPDTPFTIESYAQQSFDGVIYYNTFHVTGGQIDFAYYQIQGGFFDILVPFDGYYYNQLASLSGPFGAEGSTVISSITNARPSTNGSVFRAVADDAPFGPFHQPVPEPATWALMLMGFGALGAALRRRRGAAAPA